MKKFIAAITLLLAISGTTLANKQRLVYDRAANPTIGITIGNIGNGTSFTIKDQNGTVIRKGLVNNGSTINISTRNLKAGMYSFEILGDVTTFIIE